MENRFERTALLFGQQCVEKLGRARIAVFGVGGVGSYAVEVLARSGVGALTLIDNDTVDLPDINRQLIALDSTLGKYKTDVARARIADINPDCKVETKKVFVLPETIDEFDFSKFDYVIDAIDTITAKLALVEAANKANVPIISCMGAGNKLDPTLFRVTDIYSTSVCPVARTMRRELKKRGIDKLKVVCSSEKPRNIAITSSGRHAPASNAFVPAAAGVILASRVIKDLVGIEE